MIVLELDWFSKHICVFRELNQVDDDDDYEADKENLAPPPTDILEPQKLLWVEKYSPRGYTDLLSDEVDSKYFIWAKLWENLLADVVCDHARFKLACSATEAS